MDNHHGEKSNETNKHIERFMRDLAAQPIQTHLAAENRTGRDAQLIWLEAQLRRARGAERRAMLPIRIWQAIALAAIVCAVSFALVRASVFLVEIVSRLGMPNVESLAPRLFRVADDIASLLVSLAPVMLLSVLCLCIFNFALAWSAKAGSAGVPPA